MGNEFILILVTASIPRIAMRGLLLAAACLPLAGCDPIFDIAGAYFPSWILSMVLGMVACLVLREVLVRTGVDKHLFLKPAAYTGFFLSVACWIWLVFFAN